MFSNQEIDDEQARLMTNHRFDLRDEIG